MPTRKTAAKKTAQPAKKSSAKVPARYDDGYRASYAEAAYQFALLGATDEQMCKAWSISTATLHKWKSKPEFMAALESGKLPSDGKVAHSLLQRAMGYEHDDTDIRVVNGKIVKTTIRKYYPPDTVACIFWLKNRRKEHWRDKVETGVTDKDGKDVPPMDPVEVARRLAFILAQGDAALTKKGASNG